MMILRGMTTAVWDSPTATATTGVTTVFKRSGSQQRLQSRAGQWNLPQRFRHGSRRGLGPGYSRGWVPLPY